MEIGLFGAELVHLWILEARGRGLKGFEGGAESMGYVWVLRFLIDLWGEDG